MSGVPEVANVDKPDEDADNTDDLGEHAAKVIQLALEWGLLGNLTGDGFVNVANGSLLTSEDDNCLGSSINDSGAL